jgi:hypothetical protein
LSVSGSRWIALVTHGQPANRIFDAAAHRFTNRQQDMEAGQADAGQFGLDHLRTGSMQLRFGTPRSNAVITMR